MYFGSLPPAVHRHGRRPSFALFVPIRSMSLFKHASFQRKIALLVAVAVVGVLTLMAINLSQLRQQVLAGRRAELVSAVQSAHSIVAAYQAKAAAGAMPEAAAQQAAVEALRLARFGGADGKGNYFYIWALDGTGVEHPFKPEWHGQPMLGKVLDGNGVDVVASLIKGVKDSADGRAFVDTNFPRPGQSVSVPKLQYVVKVDGWNWLVGAGLYLDDVDAEVRAQMASRLAIAMVLMLAIGTVGFSIARGVLRQIGGEPEDAIRVMHEVAQGNLNVDLHTAAPGSMLAALQGMVKSLQRTVMQVRSATDGLNQAAVEIAGGNQDLSARTEQTASNLQQTASAMEELTATVNQSADAAAQAHRLAGGASSVATRGGEMMAQVVQTMDEISASSKKIADIIGVIDGIAFQTNILALNAAVEAARAGEQGRGFAVVAGEVRTLAQRSAAAAKEIKALIGNSVDCVEAGTGLVQQAGGTMQEILDAVRQVGAIIGEISNAAQEQASGIGQVNTAVVELDQMTQQNAALVEQSAAAAASLKSQSQQLAQVVQVFRLQAA
jgi:methyl-accepting chemotaxis protein